MLGAKNARVACNLAVRLRDILRRRIFLVFTMIVKENFSFLVTP